MTIGLLMRNANVTPSGMPASTKPMNSGTAEHEQNGVTIPNAAAATVPANVPRPARAARTRSGGKNPRMSVTMVMMPSSRRRTLGTSSRKNATASPRCEPRCRPRIENVNQSESGASASQPTSQAAADTPTASRNGMRRRTADADRAVTGGPRLG